MCCRETTILFSQSVSMTGKNTAVTDTLGPGERNEECGCERDGGEEWRGMEESREGHGSVGELSMAVD
jgi:hypothetical protein